MNDYTLVPKISRKCDRVPRDYQLELYEIARNANTIVALPTGSGKTLISSLLMYHYLTHPNHQDQLIVYLAPTGMLASQQSKALVVDAYELFEDTNVCVQLVTGSKSELISYNENITEQCVNLKQISTWKFILNSINKKKNLDCVFQDKLTECEEQDSSSSSSSFDSTLSSSTLIVPKVFVFTPEIFLSNLCHGYFSMENIAVIIFDECHHVFGKSVYNEIMSIFYHHHYPNGGQKPSTRILGLTATPFNIVPYAKMNPNTILKSIHDDMHFIEAIYDSKLHFRLYTALSAGDDCFYSDTFSHLNWKYTIDTLLWDPFTLIVTMNAAELNVSEGFLTRDSYKAFIHEIRQLRWCQPLSETSENHSKCWSAKFMKRIKRNKTLLYKVTQLRMRWNTEKLSIQKSIMETWIKFRNQCDIILKEHGLWGVIVLLDALVKSCRTKTTKSQSSSGSFLCNVSQLLSVIEFLETTPTATSGRQWINNYFIFEKKRIKFQKNLMDLFILLYSFFKRKTHIPFMIRTFGGKSLMELYLTHLVSPKVIELEKVIRTLLDRFQPEEYKNHCNSFWKSEKPCHPFHSENDLNSLSVLSNISGSNSIENHNVCIRELEKTSKTSRVATCENRKPLSQLDYYLSKQEKNAFQRSTNKKKNVSQSMLKKDSEEDNDSRKCTILTSYSKKIVHDSKKNLDSEDNQESQDLIYKPFQSHVVSDSSSLELSDSHSEKNHMAPEENTLESVVEFPYYLSNMKCIVFTKTRVEAWLMHQYCQLRGISRTNYVISLSHTNLTHSNLLRYESVLNYSEITNRFSLPVLPKLNYLNILFSTNVLLEGFDVSCCNSAISLNPMRSILDYIQCRGRIREKSNIKSCFKTICPDSVTKNEFILMHRLYDIECLLLKAFNSHQHDPKKCLLLFKPLHTVLYEPTTKACISENCAFREANEIMIRYIRLEDDKICHMSLVILYDHIRSQKTKNFDNSMFPPFKKMLLEYTEETKTYQQMLTEMLDCLEMYLKDHNSTTLLTFIKLLYENNIINSYFFLHSDTRNLTTLFEKKKKKALPVALTNTNILWREPCALLCPDHFEVFVLNAKTLQDNINPYSFFQYIFQKISIGINSLTPIVSLLKEKQLCNSLCDHFIKTCEDATSAAWLLPVDQPNGLHLYVHRIFCCVESSHSVILSSGGLMGYWRPFYRVETNSQNDVSCSDSYFENIIETILCTDTEKQTDNSVMDLHEKALLDVYTPIVTKLSGHCRRVLMPLALLLPFKLPKRIDIVGCYGQFAEKIRIEVEPCVSDGIHTADYYFSSLGMLALIRFCQSLLHTLAIKGCYPKTSDLRHYEKSLPEILTSRIKHALWDSPFILFAPLMSDGKRLDFNYIATYLKIIFLSFPSSKHSFLSKNTTNPTFYQYWLSSNQAFQSFIKRIPGVVTPFQNTQCGINVLLNQISVQTAHLFLTKKKLKQKDSIDHNDRDIDKKYVIDLNLDNNRPLYDHISDVVTLFERRQLESPVIRLTHDPSCQHRFAQLQGITLNYFPDNFYPNNSEVSLTKMYQLDRSLLKNMDEAKAAKIPILVGLRLQQGSHNIFINKTLSRTKKSKLDSYYDSRLTSLLPLTTPMFQQLTWMSCVMYKLDLWSKQYELTKKLETQMNVLALIIQKYLQFHLQKKLNIKPIILNERLVSLAMTAPSSRVLNEEVDYKTPWGRSDMDNALTLNERDSEENFTRNDYTENTWMKYCHKDPHSQRIEFLGDSVLKCITTIFFFFLGVSLDEGELTDRAHFIQANKFLKHCSENMNLHSYIAASVFMSRNAFFTGPTTITMMRRQVLSNKMQADAVEALIAAIYLSSICVEKETVSILPFSCVSESFYEELEFNCLLAGSIGKFNDGLKASVILLDILTLQEDNAIVPFSFGALWYTILNFNLNKKISSVCTQVKNCPSNLFLEKDQNNFPEFLNEKMNSKFIKTISHTYHFYISYKKIIDDSFIKEFSFNFPTHAPPVTNKQLTHLWNQQYAQEPLNKFSGIVTIARTHRSIASHMDLTHSYEQLEYLGDGVLSLLITDYLYKEFPLYDEGMLSNCKSLLQSNIFLAIRFLRKLVTHNEQVNISVIPASGILLCLLDDSFDMMENFVTQLITIPLQDDPMIAFYLQKYYITLANPDAKTKPSQTIHNYIDIASLPTLQQMKRIADVYESLLGATFLVTSCNLEHCWNCIQDDFNSVREFLVSKVFRNMT